MAIAKLMSVIVAAVLMTGASSAQENDQSKVKTAIEQTVSPPTGIDREKFKNEALKLEQKTIKLPDGPEAGLFEKHHYCIKCQDGQRHTCVMPAGGEVGRVMCSGKCIAVCSGGCSIGFGGC